MLEPRIRSALLLNTSQGVYVFPDAVVATHSRGYTLSHRDLVSFFVSPSLALSLSGTRSLHLSVFLLSPGLFFSLSLLIFFPFLWNSFPPPSPPRQLAL